ncbi:hypothetical protein QMK19_29705 [Streptomyces sp. H10-C2]|uniref:hypothetical protein n=1 Tax=unclassified Streptomyces TaxID=2593676 RepID=UPI0024BB9FD9|nr:MULTISPECIES: hypothetical protein [unclassified Streptomyces]MDJ0344347.1 hypothetical protein [Streptomyces sp. PH10-H1]MDJ0373716.1 hypothetical protein [Streptomyces sp. H10-C2]
MRLIALLLPDTRRDHLHHLPRRKKRKPILLSDDASEAETRHALLTAGRVAVIERVMIGGYAALAAPENDEDRDSRRAMRARAARLGD